ncbi:uncharacterized protein ACNS7B_011652 isoform 2-T2 [Menidia menidia]
MWEGFLRAAFVWMVFLMHGWGTHRCAAGLPCRPKELTALTKSLVEASLTSFDEANGKHLGTWSPGFPELEVHPESPPTGPQVQCSLHFLAQGLLKVLHDQRTSIFPRDAPLLQTLRDAVSRVQQLEACVKSYFGGECAPKPPPPKMPKYVFERKQWSHTLIKSARDYLNWLQHKFQNQISKARKTSKMKWSTQKAKNLGYFVGREHQL